MTKPHKHADVIKAWADGKQVQWAHPVAPSITDPLCQREPVWGEWTWHLLGIPSFDEIYLWRVKPDHKWQKERDAFARGERIQWRSTRKKHAGMGWLDVPHKSPLVGSAFDEPTNEFRIPHKWQAEMDARARGEDIEARLCGSDDWRSCHSPAWYSDGSCEYRVKPKTVKTRIRVAAMGEPNGEGRIWVWSVHTDEHAAQAERNEHFLRWLGGWHEVERPEPPAEGILSAGRISAAKISDGTIDCGKNPFGELHAMGFDAAKPGSDRTVVWCSSGEWPPRGGFSWGIR